ncbi:MAG: phosphate ABC transporter substrate-binding/OmpA family protein [Pseudomonadota bacterium]
MSGHLKVALSALALGAVLLLGAKLALPYVRDLLQLQSSDAKGTIGEFSVAIDNWVGYFPLCSPEMKQRLRSAGYRLACENDGADIDGRMRKLRDGELDFAVATVDSYVLAGANYEYPGAIVAVIDESKGGDALVSQKSKIANIDSLKDLPNLRIAFTPDSPSHHLLRALSVHFDIERLREKTTWRVDSQGSSEALKKLLAGDVTAAVLWEPDVSSALTEPSLHRLIGTEDTHQLIVDILLVSRKLLRKEPERVHLFVKTYFDTLNAYLDDDDRLLDDWSDSANLDRDQAAASLRGLVWSGVKANAERWFAVGGGPPALVETIDDTIDILNEFGTLPGNPLPDGDPLRLTNSASVKNILAQDGKNALVTRSSARTFSRLSESEWDRLRDVGTLKIRPIVFSSGTAELTTDGKRQLDAAATHLAHYPNYRVSINGHTGLRGDPDINKELSLARATAVRDYLREARSVVAERMRPIGYGASRPLERQPGESNRSFNYRLPRVELVLVSGGF